MRILLDREHAILNESSAFIKNLKNNIEFNETELARITASVLEHTDIEGRLVESLRAIRSQIQDLESKEATFKAQTANAITGLKCITMFCGYCCDLHVHVFQHTERLRKNTTDAEQTITEMQIPELEAQVAACSFFHLEVFGRCHIVLLIKICSLFTDSSKSRPLI